MIRSLAIQTIVIAFASALCTVGVCVAAGKSAQESWLEYRNRLLADPAVIAYFDFQEAAGDTLNNRAKATPELKGIIRGATRVNGMWPGKGALSFAGNACVEIPHHPSLFPLDREKGGTGELTIEVWLNARTTQEAGIIDKWSAGWGVEDPKTGEGGAPYALWISTKKVMGIISGKTQNPVARDEADLATDAWVHLVFTVDGSHLSLYKNGVLAGQAPRTVIPMDKGKPLLIGCMKPGVFGFQGLIQEVALYNRALAGKEVGEHYDAIRRIMTETQVQQLQVLQKEISALEAQVEPAAIKGELSRLLLLSKEKLSPVLSKLQSGASLEPEEWKRCSEDVSRIKADFDKIVWKARLSVLLKQL